MPVSGINTSGDSLAVDLNPTQGTTTLSDSVAAAGASIGNMANEGMTNMTQGAASGNISQMLQGQLQSGEAQAEQSALSSEIKDEVELMKQIAQNMAT